MYRFLSEQRYDWQVHETDFVEDIGMHKTLVIVHLTSADGEVCWCSIRFPYLAGVGGRQQ